MKDSERYHVHGPLQPASYNDPWHDRPYRGTIRLVLLVAGVIFAAALLVHSLTGATP